MPDPSQTLTLPEEPQTQGASATGASTNGDTVDVWTYLALNINDFAVAKSIVDHFEKCPSDLHKGPVDTFGLFLRAKVTLKREQIAYAIEQSAVAETQRALAKAQQESRSLRGTLRRTVEFARNLRVAITANPSPVLLAGCMAVMLWFR